MNIGEKIKDLRCAKMMTQHELAGTMITRNMLSRIENGCALPSVPTLVYLAQRLGVPAGYLLAEEDSEFIYRKITGMPDIKRAFLASDWQICRDLCRNLGQQDDEIKYIVNQCIYNEALDSFRMGDLRNAAALFNEVRCSASESVYPLDTLVAECETYLLCIATVSQSLVSDIETVSEPVPSSLADSFCRYFSVLISLNNNDSGFIDPSKYQHFTKVSEGQYSEHIVAKLKMRSGHYNEAYHMLKKLLSSDAEISAPMLYFIFCDLEVCCRELSDYRGAYEFSADKTGMLERFLG